MDTATLGRLVGDVHNALDWLEEAWALQKRGDMLTKHCLIEAGERLQGAAVQIATDLGWQKEWKRRDDPKRGVPYAESLPSSFEGIANGSA